MSNATLTNIKGGQAKYAASSVRDQHDLPFKADPLDASVRVRNGVKRNAFGHAGLDLAAFQHSNHLAEVGDEPVRVLLAQ